MTFFDLLVIFLILVVLIPLVRQKMLDSARLRLLHQLEEKRGSRVIALIHREESLSLLGFPVARYLDIQDSEEVLRAIKLTDESIPIDLILHTPGGLVLASEQIANAICKRTAPITVFIPHYAMSGGTLIALAADEIVMDPNAVLGPVDPQIGPYPAASILSVLEQKDINKIGDETLIQADIAKKAVNQVRQVVHDIAVKHFDPVKADELSEIMSSGRWTHDYPISVEEARGLGLKVSTDVPAEIYQLMNLYPQATQRRPSVVYVPMPYPNRPAQPRRGGRAE